MYQDQIARPYRGRDAGGAGPGGRAEDELVRAIAPAPLVRAVGDLMGLDQHLFVAAEVGGVDFGGDALLRLFHAVQSLALHREWHVVWPLVGERAGAG